MAYSNTAGYANASRQEAVVCSCQVSSGFRCWPGTRPRDRGGRVNITPPFPTPILSLPKANVAPVGFCCMIGYIQLLRLAGLEECCGCAPSHWLVSEARRNIKAPQRRGRAMGRRGLRGSCLIGQSRGALSLSHGWWLIYHSTGEVKPHRPPIPVHHTLTHFIDRYPWLLSISTVFELPWASMGLLYCLAISLDKL